MPRPRTKQAQSSDPELAGIAPHDRLIICARELFQERSFDGVSIRDLMQAANVTQPTIYYYFQNKDGLFLAALLDLVQELDEDFSRASREKTFSLQLQGLAQAFTRPPSPNLPLLCRNLEQRVQLNNQQVEQGITMAEARAVYVYTNQTWPKTLENLIRDARRTGEIQAANPTFLAHYLLTLLAAYPHSPFNRLTANSPEQSVNALLEYLRTSFKTINVSVQI